MKWRGCAGRTHPDAAQAHVREIVAEGLHGVILTSPKTSKSRRTVYLSPDTVTLLRGVLAQQALHKAALNGAVRGHSWDYQRRRP
ncbi:hypothetical protein HLB42_06695 [Deinococcus sp. D7000]|nr:hypothetical protein HLB42_06695 [Deinococcus sp. D7000]